MAKALIWSDLHIHAHKDNVDRLHDCLQVLRWAFDTAEVKGCDYIFFLGDLFHDRSKIDILNYLRTFEVFVDYMVTRSSPIQVFLLVGNHDMYHRERWDVNSVKPMNVISNVEIIDQPCTKVLGGRPVDFLPYTANPVEDLKKLKDRDGSILGHDILLSHLAVDGAILNRLYGTKADVIVEYDNEMTPVTVDLFDDWKMTFLGHYHASQMLNDKVEYVGSPLQLSYGEVFQEKHLIVLDLATLEKEYITNNFSPRHYIIPPSDIDAYDLNGQFVRVVVDDMSRKDLVDIRQEVLDKYKVATFDFKEDDKKPQKDQDVVDQVKANLNNLDDVLRNYIEATGAHSGLNKDLLLKIGEEICQIAE